MAVYVNISDTRHLTYSPLNEKHNILYDSARHNINQRYVHKPWFDLRPLLDRADQNVISLEEFRPEQDRGPPLTSIVVVEDYFENFPQSVQELDLREYHNLIIMRIDVLHFSATVST